MRCTFPVFFLSYDEPNAEQNWLKLKSRFPDANRVHGVNGIFDAHRTCAGKTHESHFFVVDADNDLEADFDFSVSDTNFYQDAIHVWRCRNAVNDLIYGYGAIKLFPKSAVLRTEKNLDLSTGLGVPYKIVPILASTTHFNSDPFHSWRSGFREAVKLTEQIMRGAAPPETSERLNIWCTKGMDRPFGRWCIEGAQAGKAYAERQFEHPEYLKKINDFHWLHQTFVEKFPLDG